LFHATKIGGYIVEPISVFCDVVETASVHNGVVRINFVRLDKNSKPVPALELLLPVNQVATIMRALQQIQRPPS
jgi:hypothetical protein